MTRFDPVTGDDLDADPEEAAEFQRKHAYYSPDSAYDVFVNWLMKHAYSGRGNGTQGRLTYSGASAIAQTARHLLWGQNRCSLPGYGKEWPHLDQLPSAERIMENRMCLGQTRVAYADAALRWLPGFFKEYGLPPLDFGDEYRATHRGAAGETPCMDYGDLVALIQHSIRKKYLTAAWFREARWGTHLWTKVDDDGDLCYGLSSRDGCMWEWPDEAAVRLIEAVYEASPNCIFVFCTADGLPLTTRAIMLMTGRIPEQDLRISAGRVRET